MAAMALIGGAILLIGMIGIVIAAFRVSALWGVLTLFIPITALLFVPLHWRESKGPMLILALGFAFTAVTAVAGGKQQEALNPKQITNPVYLELRGKQNAGGRELEQMVMVETTNEADCQAQAAQWRTQLTGWTLSASTCSTTLAPRFAPLFRNQKMSYPYLSAARGVPTERETRIVLWGYSTAEVALVCQHGQRYQASRKGPISCIQP